MLSSPSLSHLLYHCNCHFLWFTNKSFNTEYKLFSYCMLHSSQFPIISRTHFVPPLNTVTYVTPAGIAHYKVLFASLTTSGVLETGFTEQRENVILWHNSSSLGHNRELIVIMCNSALLTSVQGKQVSNQGLNKHSLTFRHRASSIQDRHFTTLQRRLFIYLINKYISLSDICLTVHHWYK